MTSPKPYDVLVSACEHLSINYNKERQSQLNSFLLCSILLSQNGSFQALMDNIQNSPICVRKMSKRETEKKKKFCLYRGSEWETKRQMGQQGETEKGRGKGWEWWEQRGLLSTWYIWFAATKLSCAIQKQRLIFWISSSQRYAFVFGKIVRSLICFCFA